MTVPELHAIQPGVDRDRVERIIEHVRGKLAAATTALDAENPNEAGIALRESFYLLDIAADLAGSPAEAEAPPTRDREAQVGRWERGEEFPCRADRRAIAQALGTLEEDLFVDA